jgi:hypothetical protein
VQKIQFSKKSKLLIPHSYLTELNRRKGAKKLTTILKTLNHHAIEYPSSKLSKETSLCLEDVIDYLKHSIGAQTSLSWSLLNPLHFTNSSMQTRFALLSNSNPAFKHHLLKNNRVVLSNLHQVNFHSASPPLLKRLSRVCPNTLFTYPLFPKLGMHKGKLLYLPTPRS